MAKLKCIIFDIDGTLTQTNELIFATFNYVAKKYLGKTFTPNEITAMFGPPEEVAIQQFVGEERFPLAMADFFDFYKSNFCSLARAYPGVIEILDFLKGKNIILAVFTGKGLHSTEITLEQLGIKHYFNMIVTGHDVVEHKPSSEGIRKVIEKYQLQPDEVLMVGDSVSDVKASHEAGITIAAVVLDSYGKEHILQMRTDYVFHSVTELSAWLKKTLV